MDIVYEAVTGISRSSQGPQVRKDGGFKRAPSGQSAAKRIADQHANRSKSTAAAQDAWHEGEPLVPRTFSRTEAHVVLVSRPLTKTLRYNLESTIWYSLDRLASKVCVEFNKKLVESVPRTSQRNRENRFAIREASGLLVADIGKAEAS